jgi:hypothetical protein
VPILQDIDRGRRRLGRQVHRICKSDDTKLTNVGLSSSDSRRGAEEIAVSKASNLESSARTHSLYGPPSSRYTVQTSGDGAPSGYRREGNYYVPVTSAQQPVSTQPSNYGDSAPPGYRREGNYYVPITSDQQPVSTQPSNHGDGAPPGYRGEGNYYVPITSDQQPVSTQPSNRGDGAPPGYRREGNYYVPISSAQKPTRSQPSTYGSTNSTGPLPQPIRMENNRDPRDLLRNLRDPRDPRDPRDSKASTKIQDYPLDPRYAYPSPAATMTGSVISYNRSVVSQIPR